MAKLHKKPRRGGGFFYYWRATVPQRQEDGSIAHVRVERSTKTSNYAKARDIAKRFEAEFHAAADDDSPVPSSDDEMTFAGAALLYMKGGGERRFLAPIIAEIGEMPIIDIDQVVVQSVVDKLMPDAAPSTVNRQIYTPISAVINKAAKAGKCKRPMLDRPDGHDKQKPLAVPDQAWFDAVLPQCSKKLRACLLMITCHGLRIADAIERTPDDIEAEGWILHIPRTKNGEPAAVPLAPPVVEALKDYNWRGEKWLFGTHSRSNISRAVKAACARANVRYFGTHAIGRHAFSVRVLKAGKSVKFLKEAGRWKSPQVPMKRYGHLERSEVNEEVKEIATNWAEKTKSRQVVRIKKA